MAGAFQILSGSLTPQWGGICWGLCLPTPDLLAEIRNLDFPRWAPLAHIPPLPLGEGWTGRPEGPLPAAVPSFCSHW